MTPLKEATEAVARAKLAHQKAVEEYQASFKLDYEKAINCRRLYHEYEAACRNLEELQKRCGQQE